MKRDLENRLDFHQLRIETYEAKGFDKLSQFEREQLAYSQLMAGRIIDQLAKEDGVKVVKKDS
jgi:hypothetical protein